MNKKLVQMEERTKKAVVVSDYVFLEMGVCIVMLRWQALGVTGLETRESEPRYVVFQPGNAKCHIQYIIINTHNSIILYTTISHTFILQTEFLNLNYNFQVCLIYVCV